MEAARDRATNGALASVCVCVWPCVCVCVCEQRSA